MCYLNNLFTFMLQFIEELSNGRASSCNLVDSKFDTFWVTDHVLQRGRPRKSTAPVAHDHPGIKHILSWMKCEIDVTQVLQLNQEISWYVPHKIIHASFKLGNKITFGLLISIPMRCAMPRCTLFEGSYEWTNKTLTTNHNE